ncbi:MAG: choice-of-anchor J domain-containing protein [Candidatus Sabulitectum sp.]|nr:choice-of-anchor J domain-containing protein [Candidatus Sabulitectum sp.]
MLPIVLMLHSLIFNTPCLQENNERGTSRLFLERQNGSLGYYAPLGEFELYFHIPIAYESQAPVQLIIEAPNLIDYRFLNLESGNTLCVARVFSLDAIYEINWESHVVVERNTWYDLPSYVPMPLPESLPDSVIPWLIPTDCVQLESPYVIEALQEVAPGTDNVIELADSIAAYCDNIPWQFPHIPKAHDAHYALCWGGSCTGHSHVAAALFRGNGIPCRILLNLMPTNPVTLCDHHWIVDYFLPDYGWVTLESSTGVHPVRPQNRIVTFINQPYHEFTKWYPNSIDALWHTSSKSIPGLGWGLAHSAEHEGAFCSSSDSVSVAADVARTLWNLHTECTGLILTQEQADQRTLALQYMQTAYNYLHNYDIAGYLYNAQTSIDLYESIKPSNMTTIFNEDFESGINGWTHGGTQDKWELGTPLAGPDQAHSVSNCWGTDLSGCYNSNADNWLLSPVVDLDNKSCAELSFWLWNDTEDLGGIKRDYLFLEITTDGGSSFTHLTGKIGGINEDPLIPAEGGWSKIVLDLRRHIGNQVQFRFSFHSNAQNTFCGSYIDDVHIQGRYQDLTGVERSGNGAPLLLAVKENPCHSTAEFSVSLPSAGSASLTVYDAAGRIVSVESNSWLQSGMNTLYWNCIFNTGETAPAGVYLIRLEFESEFCTEKIVVLR